MQEDRPDRRNMLQNALGAIERLQAELQAAREARHEPIAIIGMACRTPGGATDPEDFWKLLEAGRDAVTEVPGERWDVSEFYDPDPSVMGKARTKAGGFLDDVEGFEPGFFGMSPREAASVDPQQRLLLEVTWEALESAGVPVDQLDGSLTGVFIGITSVDYSQRIDVKDPARSDIYLATGTALNAAAGRVSFTFGFRGPCMAIDTACSSSLVALHTACQSLRDRESDLAVTGGVNVILSPEPFVLISKWGMLSPDGRCRTFDAAANGFVRAEACGMVALERLSDAIAHGRRILAVIPGSAINQDGRSSGLTVPNGLAQQEVIRHALAAARLRPGDVSYVEAHGTGTSLGDPIEVEALAAVYGEGRDPSRPLELGSVKSNVGHAEAASGVLSVIKLVKALEHGRLPASLHVKQPSPAIAWDAIPVRVSTQLHDWTAHGGRRIAGASAFGFSGMNAHVLVAEPPEVPASIAAPARALQAMPLSAKSDVALAALAGRYAAWLESHPHAPLAEACATAAAGRSHFHVRTLLAASDRESLVAQLRSLQRGERPAPVTTASVGGRHRVAFLFTGQGAQYVGMGRELYDTQPAFRAAIDRCAAVLDPLLPRPLREVMFEETGGLLDQTGCTQPALFAIEVALASMWRSWGVEPAVVIGHSVGEFAAAVVAGVFSLEDGARLIAARGRLMQALPAGGAMVSIEGDVAVVQRELEPHAAQVSIAACNAPGNVVIAGAGAAVEAVVGRLVAAGLVAKPLVVSHAFHSPLMAPMMDEFGAIAGRVAHARPSITWISNLTGAPLDWALWGSRMAEYWTRHVREPVAFERGMAALAATGCDVHLEVGPHPTLIGLGMRCAGSERAVDWLPSLKRNRTPWQQVLESVGRLYGRGARIDWAAFVGGVRASLPLPTYPFQRQKYIVPFPSSRRRRAGDRVHELLGERLAVAGVEAQFEREVSGADPAWLRDHRIAGEVVMPLTAYLEVALAASRLAVDAGVDSLESVEMTEPMPIGEGSGREMQVSVAKAEDASHRVRVYSREAANPQAAWTLHATATAGGALPAPGALEALDAVAARLDGEVDVPRFYEKLQALGVDFGPAFRALQRGRSGPGEALAEIEIDPAALGEGRYLFHPAMLDACFQASALAIEALPGADDRDMYLPIGVDRYRWFATPAGTLRSHARVRAPATRGDMLVLDLRIESAEGAPVALLEGLRCRRASRDMFRQRVEARVGEWLYEVVWRPEPLAAAPAAAPAGGWIVLDEGQGRGARLAEELGRLGARVVRVGPAGEAGDAPVAIDPADPAAWERMLREASADGALAGVVSLWPLRVPALGPDDVPSAVQRFGTDAALRLLQAAAKSGAPRVWLATAGSQAVDGTERVRVAQAPVAGLARVAANEHPELRVTCVDLDPQATPADARLLADEVLADGEERQVAYRKGVRLVARLARKPRRGNAPHVDEAPVRLDISARGTLENLAIAPGVRRPPGPGEVEIRVRASGLNFRDVLSALGMYPGELRHLGSDCSGEVVAVGEGVTQFRPGDRVVAMTEGAFASHATTRWEFVAPLPQGLDFEQGASIPTAYLTADITLNLLGKMKRGDKVLIHSGAGGVGMAAIALALRAGAEIFATAGSAEKRAVLDRLGVHHALDSRSASFADDVKRITGGRGVDLVLNSLAGELLDRSFDCVADGGVFLEIGKRGLWSHERVAALGRRIRYHIVDCNDNARDTPRIVGEIFTRVLREIESGVLPTLPVTTFRFEDAQDAFRYMAQARHVGRVVFRHRVEPRRVEQPVAEGKAYAVTGGLKGLGLVAAQWLVAEGARHVVLAGRSAPDEHARGVVAALEQAGATVRCIAADVGTAAGVAAVVDALKASGLPPGGILHGAAVLEDGMLARQDPARFARVMAPKADGAWRLHSALARARLRPDFLVLYSSLSSVFGASGQGNYVAANAFLDALAQRRRADDEPALAVDWGAWSEVGMAARGGTVGRAGAQGLHALSPAEGMQVLDLLLRDGSVQAAAAPIDWATLAGPPGAPVPPLLRDIVERERGRGASAAGPTVEAKVDFGALAPAERATALLALVQREVAKVLGLAGSADSIPTDQAFTQLGMDSLTSVELRNRLQTVLGRSISATAVFEWPTVAQMAVHLDSLYGAASGEPEGERETLTL